MSNSEKGSKLRCSLLAQENDEDIAKFFNKMIEDHGTVDEGDIWQPSSKKKGETALTDLSHFLNLDDYENLEKNSLLRWWLQKGNVIPRWDYVCTFSKDKEKGLILVEAKSHSGEFKTSGDYCNSKSEDNIKSIRTCIEKANNALNKFVCGFNLSTKGCYQLTNRFAFAWKLASLGVPVILVYLGFLNAKEMNNYFKDHNEWETCVTEGSKKIIPSGVWKNGKKGKTFYLNGDENTGTSLTFLIKSAELNTKFEIPD